MALTEAELLEKVNERQGAVEIREQLQAQIDGISAELKAECGLRGVRRIPSGPWDVLMVGQERKTINVKKLLSAGVSVAQIEAATETTHVEQLRVNVRAAS